MSKSLIFAIAILTVCWSRCAGGYDDGAGYSYGDSYVYYDDYDEDDAAPTVRIEGENPCSSVTVSEDNPIWIGAAANSSKQVHVFCEGILYAENITEFVQEEDVTALEVVAASFTNVTATTFFSLTRLVRLKITFGVLQRLDDSCFNRLHMLQELDLSGNAINSIADTSFDGLGDLLVLNLDNNSLASFQPMTFVSMTKLRVLSLRFNQVRMLSSDMFAGLVQLVDLRLDSNNISRVSTNAFRELRHLKMLSLKANRLTKVPSSSFSPLVALEDLTISRNPLRRKLSKSTFAPLRSTLTHLFMAECELTQLAKKMFDNFTRLQMIVATGNRLQRVPNLGAAPVMREMHLYDNPIACDCQLAAMRRWMSRNGGDADVIVTALCATPFARKGKPITDYSTDELCNIAIVEDDPSTAVVTTAAERWATRRVPPATTEATSAAAPEEPATTAITTGTTTVRVAAADDNYRASYIRQIITVSVALVVAAAVVAVGVAVAKHLRRRPSLTGNDAIEAPEPPMASSTDADEIAEPAT